MSTVPIRQQKPDEVLELLRELVAEVRGLRSDWRRHSPVAVPALIAALEEVLGPARFTARTLLQVVDDDPHGVLAEAVAQVVDMNLSLRSRATSLGALLSRLPEVETVAYQRGASLYKLRTYPG